MKRNQILCHFSFVCDQKWGKLKRWKADDPEMPPLEATPSCRGVLLEARFCDLCKKNVYRCRSMNELREHAALGHCVAVGERYRAHTLGVVAPPYRINDSEED